MSNYYNQTAYVLADTSLKYKIRHLMTQYSASEIHTAMQDVFREDYVFYESLFTPAAAPTNTQAPLAQLLVQTQATPLTQSVVNADPQVETVISTTTKLRPNAQIRVVKKPVVEESVVNDEEVSVVSVNVNEKERRAQIKREQSEKESKKHAELVSKGFDPEGLLTKENLKKWIEVDNLTYAQISRDHVGLPSVQVSAVAKGFGLKSQNAKRRAMILASKK